MKELYEKPKMTTEKVEMGLISAGGSPVPAPQLQPYFGLCPPCP